MDAPRRLIRLPCLLLSALVACQPADTGPSPTLRLTPTEYNNTLRDLYGYEPGEAWPAEDGSPFVLENEYDTPPWPRVLPPDVEVDGFDGMVEGQLSSAYLAEQYAEAARHFSQWAPIAPRFWTCIEWQDRPPDEARGCGWRSLRRFAEEAWRGPLSPQEERRLSQLYQDAWQEHGTEDAVKLVVQAILQSPRFLYRVEMGNLEEQEGEEVPLQPHELAARLSYFLWDGPPDDALRFAAADGRLSTPEEIEAQARRMLRDPRARDAVVRFHHQWLDLDEVFGARADYETHGPAVAPQIPEVAEGALDVEEYWSGAIIGLRRAMVYETELFVERTIFDGGGTLKHLLTDNHGYVSDVKVRGIEVDTRRLYGVSEADLHAGPNVVKTLHDSNFFFEIYLRPTTFPASERAGVLTQAAVLLANSHPVHPAPVLRGQLVLERLACETLGDPPPGVESLAPPDTQGASSTNRSRLEAVTSSASCSACHDRLNPAGFAFEHYDTLGGWRETDNGEPVDAAGRLALSGGEVLVFSDAVELAHQLAGSTQVQDCYVRSWARVALGRTETLEEAAWLEALQQSFQATDGDIQELLVRIATSETFRTRRARP